jgi:voltage-gated potassium channel
MSAADEAQEPFKKRVYNVIFGYDTKAGKSFDLFLIFMIGASVLAVLFDSVDWQSEALDRALFRLEWFFTIAFTLEYGLRIYSSVHPRRYVLSFYGLIDLLSILPTYLAFFYAGANFLVVIRILRVLRIFRILKLFRYIGEANMLFGALVNARRKIFIFMFAVFNLVIVFGTLMFIIEGPENGFNNIPTSIYWAIVTITTVGYGDIAPHTPLGQGIAALAMICGYAIIAVPTGIIGAELMQEFQMRDSPSSHRKSECPHCQAKNHQTDATYCRLCGELLAPEK